MFRSHLLSLSVFLLVGLSACGDEDAAKSAPTATPVATPAPSAAPPSAPPAPSAAPPGLPDPEEAGISDLARVSRYLFREMQAGSTGCRPSNPYAASLAYTIKVDMAANKVTKLSLVGVVANANGVESKLTEDKWPPGLTDYVACIEAPLKQTDLKPGVADGTLDTAFVLPPRADGQPI